MARPMPDSRPTKAECRVQHWFSKSFAFQALALAGLIVAGRFALSHMPDREELGARHATLRFSPLAVSAADIAPFRLAGAWTVTSDDPRFGGVSALALDRGQFIALTDSGVVIRFARPAAGRAAALVSELPGGPRNGKFKFDRDSEALVADPLGRGWWVGFENRNEAWLYDRGLTRALGRIALGEERWPINQGIEGMAADRGGILLFPESGRSIVRWTGRRGAIVPISHPRGRISDAARLPGGGLVVVHRHVTLLGFANALTLLEPAAGGGFTTARSLALRGTGRDNVEALAAERLASGGTRLWLMTDDNFQRPLRTLLIALDVPKDFGG